MGFYITVHTAKGVRAVIHVLEDLPEFTQHTSTHPAAPDQVQASEDLRVTRTDHVAAEGSGEGLPATPPPAADDKSPAPGSQLGREEGLDS